MPKTYAKLVIYLEPSQLEKFKELAASFQFPVSTLGRAIVLDGMERIKTTGQLPLTGKDDLPDKV
jgi:hypothetical protein